MSYRIKVTERDLSGFSTLKSFEYGAMALRSKMGPKVPILCESDEDVLTYFGEPNSTYFGVFEALEYVKYAPIWLVSAIGANAKYAGIDVKAAVVEGFGARTGRDLDSFLYNMAVINAPDYAAGVGNGITAIYSGSLTYQDVEEGSLILYVGGIAKAATDSGGTISGADVTAGSIVYATGVFSVTFAGVPGTPADYTTKIDLSGNVDLSGGKPKAVNIMVDTTLLANINFGSGAATTREQIIAAINLASQAALGEDIATTAGTQFITITGLIGDAVNGKIRITVPSDTGTYDSGVALIFDNAATPPLVEDTASTNPTGSIPRFNQAVTIDYNYTTDLRSLVSHSFFARSPYNDADFKLAAKIQNIEVNNTPTKQYTMTLYRKYSSTSYVEIAVYTYSLLQEKDNFGKSLYIFDVFRDNAYVIPKVNTDYTGAIAQPSATIVDFSGGNRGDVPMTSDFEDAWNQFQQKNKYPVKTFMDVYGMYANKLVDLVSVYQPYAFAISTIPLGNNAASAKMYRQGLGIDEDNIAIYTNWGRIEDVYNNSSAWTSMIGKVGAKYAMMEDTYDALAPAGIDEDEHGGQLAGFRVLEVENDYTEAEKQLLDEAQINPIIYDPVYGVMVVGDRTLQVSNSDTSYIGTRRMYNLLIDSVIEQVLRKQEFKLNDAFHRLMAKSLTESLILPVYEKNLLREFYVQCDEKNNTDEILNQRKFILDIFVKVTPTSEFVHLKFTRLSQTQTIAEFVAA